MKPIRGEYTKNFDTFTKMDPYLLITYNAIVKKTTVANGQGKVPKWNNIFCFEWNPISP